MRNVKSPDLCTMRGTQGFTLIELLVVISIISVLAVMGTSVVNNAGQGRREIQSINQLRQIGIAMNSYASENRNFFPPGYFYGKVDDRMVEKTYASELLPYFGFPTKYYEAVNNLFVSPNSSVPVRSGVAATFTPFTYSVHGVLCGDISNGDKRMSRQNVQRPTQVILAGDGCQLANTFSAANFSNPMQFGSTGSTMNLDNLIPFNLDVDDGSGRGNLRYRNRGKAAVVMVDGHCEMLQKGTIRYRNVIVDR